LPIGAGTIDFPGIMTSLVSVGYGGTLTLEVKPEFHEAGKVRIETLLKEIQKI
jgi:sugar phosphate isomerase/epimerase